MNSKWKDIWSKKGLVSIDLAKDEFSVFCELKKTDGFDVNVHDEQLYFEHFYNDWINMYNILNQITGNSLRSVYEVGCGSGVNLYLFQNRIKNAILGGIDYSQGLVEIAQNILPDGSLLCGNAENMDIETKYDLVMADSVFQYFGSREYAKDILEKMILKSNKVVYISEIHDMDLQKEWLEYRRKSMDNYDQIYEGLGKMFYSREWIDDIAKKFGKQTSFTKSNNPEYWNSKYVFNCFIF